MWVKLRNSIVYPRGLIHYRNRHAIIVLDPNLLEDGAGYVVVRCQHLVIGPDADHFFILAMGV